jgi:pimeloyl-ACP methyl ester carboxylesterase
MRFEMPRIVCAYLEPRKSQQISSADALEVADTWLPHSHHWPCYENDLQWYGRLHRHELHFEEFARRGLHKLVIHGTADPVIPVEEARWALALVYCDADSAEMIAKAVAKFCMKRPCITCF